MADTSTDIRALMRADRTEPDSEAVAHVVAATFFLALGAIGAGIGLLAMSFTSFVPLGYGIIRPLTMLAALIGFGALSVVGGAYYVLPRLTGAPLWNEKVARLGLLVTTVTTLVGMVVVGVGLGDGGEPFSLPWWLDVPMLIGLSLPPVVAIMTVRNRVEGHSYVTIPYVVTGLAAMPLLYLATNIPGLSPVATTLGHLYFTSAFLIAGVILATLGMVYFAIVKHGDRALAGRQLAQVAYWSLLFGAGWFGIAQITPGPVPEWLASVTAVLGLALPVGFIAATANIAATLEGDWRPEGDPDPVLLSAIAGSILAVVVAALAALGGFRTTATLASNTAYWEGITYALTLGVVPLLAASWMLHSVPRMTGRQIFSADLGRRHVRLTVIGSAGIVVLLGLGGLITGYSWAGGAFTGAFNAIGEGWDTAAGVGRVFTGIGIIAGWVAVAGNLTLASLLFRTITQGRVSTQEVLVTHMAEEETAE